MKAQKIGKIAARDRLAVERESRIEKTRVAQPQNIVAVIGDIMPLDPPADLDLKIAAGYVLPLPDNGIEDRDVSRLVWFGVEIVSFDFQEPEIAAPIPYHCINVANVKITGIGERLVNCPGIKIAVVILEVLARVLFLFAHSVSNFTHRGRSRCLRAVFLLLPGITSARKKYY